MIWPFCVVAARESLRRRLHRAFLGQRGLHHRARADAGLVGHQVRQRGGVDLEEIVTVFELFGLQIDLTRS